MQKQLKTERLLRASNLKRIDELLEEQEQLKRTLEFYKTKVRKLEADRHGTNEDLLAKKERYIQELRKDLSRRENINAILSEEIRDLQATIKQLETKNHELETAVTKPQEALKK